MAKKKIGVLLAGCGVKDAVAGDLIAPFRYESYCRIQDSLLEDESGRRDRTGRR
jgi:putative ribosome biogenesis GTPase RsgA